MHGYETRPLYLPGLIIEPGDLILIVDSRGRAIRAVFKGYASKFLALANNCKEEPNRFINIQRVNEILVLKKSYCIRIELGDKNEGNECKENGSTKDNCND